MSESHISPLKPRYIVQYGLRFFSLKYYSETVSWMAGWNYK